MSTGDSPSAPPPPLAIDSARAPSPAHSQSSLASYHERNAHLRVDPRASATVFSSAGPFPLKFRCRQKLLRSSYLSNSSAFTSTLPLPPPRALSLSLPQTQPPPGQAFFYTPACRQDPPSPQRSVRRGSSTSPASAAKNRLRPTLRSAALRHLLRTPHGERLHALHCRLVAVLWDVAAVAYRCVAHRQVLGLVAAGAGARAGPTPLCAVLAVRYHGAFRRPANNLPRQACCRAP